MWLFLDPVLLIHITLFTRPYEEDQISIEHQWSFVWPYFSTETAFRTVDVNRDSVNDVIVGFATGNRG